MVGKPFKITFLTQHFVGLMNELRISVQHACSIDLELFLTILDEVYKVISSVGNDVFEVFDTMNTNMDFFLCLYIYL